MKKRRFCLAVFALAAVAGAVSSGAQETASRQRSRFDDGWKFHLLDGSAEAPPATVSGTPVKGWCWKLGSVHDTF